MACDDGCDVIGSYSEWSACNMSICLPACLPVTSLDWNQGRLTVGQYKTEMSRRVMDNYEVTNGSGCSGYVNASCGLENQLMVVVVVG